MPRNLRKEILPQRKDRSIGRRKGLAGSSLLGNQLPEQPREVGRQDNGKRKMGRERTQHLPG